jgi:hypothetical protein
VVRRNLISKPVSWKNGAWTVKNLFELKSAQRVLVAGNLFEHSWTDGQTGTGILFKSSNQNGGCGWCQTLDVTFENNIVRDIEEGLVVNASEGKAPMPPVAERILVRNSVFDASRRPFAIYNGVKDVTIDHVTALGGASILMGDGGSGRANSGLAIKNSVIERGVYGVGAGSIEGTAYLDRWFAPWEWAGNVLLVTGDDPQSTVTKRYPSSTVVRAGLGALAHRTASDFSLPDAEGAGVNMIELNRALAKFSSATTDPAPPAVGGPPVGSASSYSAAQQVADLNAFLAQLQGRLASPTPNASLFTRTLSFGLKNDPQVAALQAALKRQGIYQGPITGNYLSLTRAAVRQFQKARGLEPVGFVGPRTRAALNGSAG